MKYNEHKPNDHYAHKKTGMKIKIQSKIIKINFKNYMKKEMFLRKASMLLAKQYRPAEHRLKTTAMHQRYV